MSIFSRARKGGTPTFYNRLENSLRASTLLWSKRVIIREIPYTLERKFLNSPPILETACRLTQGFDSCKRCGERGANEESIVVIYGGTKVNSYVDTCSIGGPLLPMIVYGLRRLFSCYLFGCSLSRQWDITTNSSLSELRIPENFNKIEDSS